MAHADGVRLLPRLEALRDVCCFLAQAAKGINQIAMTAGIDQSPLIVLAVDLDQHLADLPQELHAHAGIVDEGAAAAIHTLQPPQDQRVVGGNTVLGEQSEGGMVGRQIEGCRHQTLVRTAPH